MTESIEQLVVRLNIFVLRRIRACEGEAAAQLLLEHFAKACMLEQQAKIDAHAPSLTREWRRWTCSDAILKAAEGLRG